MYLYLKALHIIFVVTWFAGMFYIVRLFVYHAEAAEKPEPDKTILGKQFAIMSRRLWYGITWPSAIITLILGITVMVNGNWHLSISDPMGRWLLIKLALVVLLIAYHLSLHRIYLQQKRNDFRYSSRQLRIWNEVATVFLVAIVMLATVKTAISFLWGIGGLVAVGIFAMGVFLLLKRRR